MMAILFCLVLFYENITEKKIIIIIFNKYKGSEMFWGKIKVGLHQHISSLGVLG